MAGRKPKPTALKKLEGNPGKRKLNTKEPVPGKGMPDCPKWLLPEANGNMDLKTVFLLDQVRKKKTISKEDYKYLKKNGLVEGRYPALFVSYKIAEAVGDKAGYVRNKGLDDKICQELIIAALQNGPLKKTDIYDAVKHALPEVLTEERRGGFACKIAKLKVKIHMM